ncbi:hypothetical protein GCM10022408_30370 [Hymenobacter fastidiosus]|uniref:Uncharacterized protein n=1 Tax=Hymenobacter fastidiosus TaxID=486264 RepID=A0ABP7SQN2_9BACT
MLNIALFVTQSVLPVEFRKAAVFPLISVTGAKGLEAQETARSGSQLRDPENISEPG